MVRVVIDLAVDTDNTEAVNANVNRFLAGLSAVGTTNVARSDVTASPDPDQATTDMLEGYRGA